MIRFGVSNGNLTVTTDTLVNGVATNVLTKSYTCELNGNQTYSITWNTSPPLGARVPYPQAHPPALPSTASPGTPML